MVGMKRQQRHYPFSPRIKGERQITKEETKGIWEGTLTAVLHTQVQHKLLPAPEDTK